VADHTSEEYDWQRREDQIVEQDEGILVKIGGIETSGTDSIFFHLGCGRRLPVEQQEPEHSEHPNNVLWAHEHLQVWVV
jgi:hypothetical protein